MLVGVSIPTPVGDHHCKGGGDKDSDWNPWVRVATVKEALHWQEEDNAKTNIKVPQIEKWPKSVECFNHKTFSIKISSCCRALVFKLLSNKIL